MTTNISINHPSILGHKIPVLACTINNARKERVVIAFVKSDAEMLKVFQERFLNLIMPNRESRFVYTSITDLCATHVVNIGAQRREEISGPPMRVLCIRTALHVAESNSRIAYVTDALGNRIFNTELNLKSIDTQEPTVFFARCSPRSFVTFYQAEAQLNNEILFRTIGCPTADGTPGSGMGHDRILYRQTVTPVLETFPLFTNPTTIGVFEHLGEKKMESLRTELFPPNPNDNGTLINDCILM